MRGKGVLLDVETVEEGFLLKRENAIVWESIVEILWERSSLPWGALRKLVLYEWAWNEEFDESSA